MLELGYLGLFVASFLAATVIPFSSEAILSGLLVLKYDVVLCVLIATLGNVLGGITSYYLGLVGNTHVLKKYMRIDLQKVDGMKQKISGKEQWIAVFTWLPIIGDLIAVALGFLQTNKLKVVLGMFLGKGLRYVITAFIMIKAIT